MPDPLSNRKKVRGWPRQHRKVEAWWRRAAELDVNAALDAEGRAYEKIDIDPWFRLVRRMPPLWLRRQMVGGLARIFDAWQAQVRTRRPQPYLRLWVAHPGFMESQIVGAAGDWADHYSALFHPVAMRLPPLPDELDPRMVPLAAGFDWKAHDGDFWIGSRKSV